MAAKGDGVDGDCVDGDRVDGDDVRKGQARTIGRKGQGHYDELAEKESPRKRPSPSSRGDQRVDHHVDSHLVPIW